MKYSKIPKLMWWLFNKSFKENLIIYFDYDKKSVNRLSKKAKIRYKEILSAIPEFEKKDQFIINIVGCAMLCSFVLEMDKNVDVDRLTQFYESAMMTPLMVKFCKKMSKNKFSKENIAKLKKSSLKRYGDGNPYSWNMEIYEYKDDSGYEARFTQCGICTLMNKLGLSHLIPSMCNLDYAMSKAGGNSIFIRKYTIASGGPYCDCGYKKK